MGVAETRNMEILNFCPNETGENREHPSLEVTSPYNITGMKNAAWVSLITNMDYLPGLLTLNYSLRKVCSRYPLVALHTDSLPAAAHADLDARHISKKRVSHLSPLAQKDFSEMPRFYETWTKLTAFSLTEYDRVVLLDSDMIVLQNMDELMDVKLDPPELGGRGNRVFAAGHECACNPLQKPYYPASWRPANCAFTLQHENPERAQIEGPPTSAGVGRVNSGNLVIVPSDGTFGLIAARLADAAATSQYTFPDQDLLSDLFGDCWVSLPYVYNAIKTLRWKGVHELIWRDDKVKNMHYTSIPKPWAEENITDVTHAWWWKMNEERLYIEALI